MAKKSAAARKTVTAANLTELGAARLATILVEVAGSDTNWKRRLKLELAAEVGAPDLALEIDKRIAALSTSKTRVSWRKRPDLIDDLSHHLRAIVGRLAVMDPALAIDRIVAWFDLYPGLAGRVKDPKGELSAVFFDAAEDLAMVATLAGPDVAAPAMFSALQTRLSDWGGWVGRAAPSMDKPVAEALLRLLTKDRPRPTGRLALVVRKLADRTGDVEIWAASIADEDRIKPDVGAEIARRLALAGRPEDARVALEACRPRSSTPPRLALKGKPIAPPAPSDAWESAEIAVLEAEGRADDAQAARWAAFERTLSEPHLRDFIARLPDFDDVEAEDRGHAVAAGWFDATKGLAFLMAWPALREAAQMILARSGEMRASGEDTALWAARLEGRHSNAALLLIRSRARGLTRLGFGRSEEVRALAVEAAEMAQTPGALDGIPSHAEFIDELEALSSSRLRRI